MHRRDFLKHLLKLTGGAAVVSTPLTTLTAPESQPEITQEQALVVLGYEPVFPDSEPAPYPDAERIAVIEDWERFIDEILIKIERFYSLIIDAKYQAPEDVDGFEFVELEHAALDAANDLGHRLEMMDMETLGKALTGKSAFYTYASYYIETGDGSRESWQRDIDSYAKENPEVAAELQTILDTRFGAKAVRS